MLCSLCSTRRKTVETFKYVAYEHLYSPLLAENQETNKQENKENK